MPSCSQYLSLVSRVGWQVLVTRTSHIPKRVKTFDFLTLNAKIELYTDLSSLVALFMEGIRTEAIKITNAVKTQLINWFVSQPAFIKALFPETVWEV